VENQKFEKKMGTKKLNFKIEVPRVGGKKCIEAQILFDYFVEFDS